MQVAEAPGVRLPLVDDLRHDRPTVVAFWIINQLFVDLERKKVNVKEEHFKFYITSVEGLTIRT